MSDQGDAGQWRPATSQSDQYSTPDDTTGPLPVISGDEDDVPGFPSVSDPSESWSAAGDDESPTGGFPAVSPEEPAAPAGRSPFEPVNRTTFSAEEPASPPEPEDPGPNGTTPRFGTGVRDAEDESSFGPGFGSGSFGESYGEPGGSSSGPDESSFASGSFGASSYGDSSYDSGGSTPGSSSFDSFGSDSFGSGSSGSSGSFGSGAYGSGSFDDQQLSDRSYDDRPLSDRSYDDQPYGARESSYGSGSFTSERDETGAPGTGRFEVPPRPPAPEKGVTAEDEAAENDFFASDDHPPMWDKVVAPSGPPPKPGKPSSGNLRLPDWMRDENGNPTGPPDGHGGMTHDEDGHSRRPLYLGLGVLVAGLIAVAGVYVLKGNGDSQASNAAAPTKTTQAPSQTPKKAASSAPLPQKPLPRFKGVHTKAVGRVTDPRAGLSYPRLAKPWAAAPKNSPMNELGFSVSQFAVTQKAGARPQHWARLMSAELSGAAKDTYSGPGSERDATAEAAQVYEARMFNFQHKKKLLASEPLNLGGHKGWLVSDYVTYRRPGTKATGDIVTVALIDTGKKAPGVLFMSVPNINRKLWPDVNFIVRSLQVT